LIPNPKKTGYTVFYPTTLTTNLQISSQHIEHQNSTKLLGIYIQQDLKHHDTIRHIIKKLQPTVRSFRYANKYLNENTMTEQYYTHIYPHLIGSISIWGTDDPHKTYIQPLIRIHKRIIRYICRSPPRAHTNPLMNRLQILSINNLYILRSAVEMHRIRSTADENRPDHVHHYIQTSNQHRYQTRFSQRKTNYIPSNSKNQRSKMNPFAREYSRIWNSLPDGLREIESTSELKTKLKTYLLAKQSGFQAICSETSTTLTPQYRAWPTTSECVDATAY